MNQKTKTKIFAHRLVREIFKTGNLSKIEKIITSRSTGRTPKLHDLIRTEMSELGIITPYRLKKLEDLLKALTDKQG